MTVVMSAAMREEFLAGARVGVLSVAAGPAGRTLAVPVWHSYQPGGLLTVLTGRRSRKAAAIRAAGRFGLCVQDGSPPYRYVSVEGPLVSEEELDPAERLAMARRYLGAAGGDRYVAANPDPRHKHVAFRMRPEHWLSQDQSDGGRKADQSSLPSRLTHTHPAAGVRPGRPGGQRAAQRARLRQGRAPGPAFSSPHGGRLPCQGEF